jgi:hypothetical protein
VRPCSARPLIVGSLVFDGGAVGAAPPDGTTSAEIAMNASTTIPAMTQRSERVL